MSPERGMSDSERTVKTTGRIVKYSREIYRLDTVEDVAHLALEAVPQVLEAIPSAAVVEVRNDDLQVHASMLPTLEAGEDPHSEWPVCRAHESGNVVVCAGGSTTVTYTDESIEQCETDEFDGHLPAGSVTVAAPTVYGEGIDEHGSILVVHWRELERVGEYHVKPVDYFGEHLATAITNIRSREDLERARNDLAKRNEMVEVYDSLLRHDLGNDMQVIQGYADVLASRTEDDEYTEYAEKILRTSRSASDLIDRVGETVESLQEEGEPTDRELEPILTRVVADTEAKFESLTVEFDPDEFDFRVYAGDLVDSVFANVVSNAAVHNVGDVSVRLYAEERTTERVVVGIADDGKGIAEATADDLFEMGKKGPDSDGTGFGLGLARALVESYGGDIDVRESDRGGADFRIVLERAG